MCTLFFLQRKNEESLDERRKKKERLRVGLLRRIRIMISIFSTYLLRDACLLHTIASGHIYVYLNDVPLFIFRDVQWVSRIMISVTTSTLTGRLFSMLTGNEIQNPQSKSRVPIRYLKVSHGHLTERSHVYFTEPVRPARSAVAVDFTQMLRVASL